MFVVLYGGINLEGKGKVWFTDPGPDPDPGPDTGPFAEVKEGFNPVD